MSNPPLVEIVDKICFRKSVSMSEDAVDNLYYENFRRGTYFATVLTWDNKIVGIGMTKKWKYDPENPKIAQTVAFSKAIRDYLKEV